MIEIDTVDSTTTRKSVMRGSARGMPGQAPVRHRGFIGASRRPFGGCHVPCLVTRAGEPDGFTAQRHGTRGRGCSAAGRVRAGSA